ncbi:V-type ATPase 116kDa subunit family protein [Allokutzneria oryzae]|uniref:V-type ATPase 116kDa subunit family protein n=1 Tax=Allokutzneria oryzae TaxID=1378989 RepID=A0ABV6A3R3_9PSEU
MPLPESLRPVRMQRIAIVATTAGLRDALRHVGVAGTVDFEDGPTETSPPGAARPSAADDAEAGVDRLARNAVCRGSVAALAGWCPERLVPDLTGRLAGRGASVVRIPPPGGLDPPTFLPAGGSVRRSFSPLVATYGTVAYPDVDPTLLAGAAYVLMFGMMFGDAGHGLLLVLGAVLLRIGWPRRLARWRSAWLFVGAAGLASTGFGLLYGEFFGPTGLVPVLWLAPMHEPVELLAASVGVGAVLLAGAYVVAIVNRWREGGPQLAVYASSGIAGAAVFLGLGGVCAGLYARSTALTAVGAGIAVAGLLLAGAGYKAAAGHGTAGVAQAGVQLFDVLIRIGTNLVSFARLAAFGLVHAALGELVWQGSRDLFALGGFLAAAAGVLLFVLGNVFTFVLEALIAAVQALRLAFYELFSRIFEQQGRPYRPWRLPADVLGRSSSKEVP